MFPPGWARLATIPVSTGYKLDANTIGIDAVACFTAIAAGARGRDNEVNLRLNQLGGEAREHVIAAVCPSHLNHERLSLDVSKFAQATPQELRAGPGIVRSVAVENSDSGNLRWLRLGGERCQCEANSENEPGPPHAHLGGRWLAGV